MRLLPQTGTYALLDGTVESWQVRRSGSRVTVTVYDAAVSARPDQIYDLRLAGGCLRQVDVRNSKGVVQGEAFPWFCAPARPFHDAYDNADAHVTERAREALTPSGQLHVRVVRTVGTGFTVLDRYLAPGRGLVRETLANSGGATIYGMFRLGGAASRRPVRVLLPDVPFGAHALHIPFQLFAPPGLPFTTYIPALSRYYPQGFEARPVRVGTASGTLFGNLADARLQTEVVFLPAGATLAQAEASLRQAERAYPHLQFQPVPNMSSAPPWSLREFQGTDAKSATDVGSADVARYQDRYLYIIRTGWYEGDMLPSLSAWRWSDAKGFAAGLGRR